MTLQARTFLNTIAGALGGLLAWVIIDLTGWFSAVFTPGAMVYQGSLTWWLQILVGGIVGGFVGVLLGLVNALGVDSPKQRLEGVVLHGAIGFGGGMVGISLGQTVYGWLAPRTASVDVMPGPGDFVQLVVARAIGWALIGAGIGLAQGIARRSSKLVTQGLFGGFVGGLIGGVLFECADTVVESGSVARFLGFVCIGACTGFFIGLFQTLFRQAWIKVVLGRNEGKEYLIDRPVMVIGRSELADIGLFGNPRIMPNHFAVEQLTGRFRLRVIFADEATLKGNVQADVKVNGQVVNPDVWLADGDSIVIDDRTLQFREKVVNRTDAPVVRQSTAVQAIPAEPIPSQQSISARLTVVDGPELGKIFPLTGATSMIGRTSDCAVALTKDTLVSRQHASINYENGAWSLLDNYSANGSYVNNVRIPSSKSRPLEPGDLIRVGESMLRFDR
jgi:pSer/pThr/pTyr-binding forkhead associated (FHA) protein